MGSLEGRRKSTDRDEKGWESRVELGGGGGGGGLDGGERRRRRALASSLSLSLSFARFVRLFWRSFFPILSLFSSVLSFLSILNVFSVLYVLYILEVLYVLGVLTFLLCLFGEAEREIERMEDRTIPRKRVFFVLRGGRHRKPWASTRCLKPPGPWPEQLALCPPRPPLPVWQAGLAGRDPGTAWKNRSRWSQAVRAGPPDPEASSGARRDDMAGHRASRRGTRTRLRPPTWRA